MIIQIKISVEVEIKLYILRPCIINCIALKRCKSASLICNQAMLSHFHKTVYTTALETNRIPQDVYMVFNVDYSEEWMLEAQKS